MCNQSCRGEALGVQCMCDLRPQIGAGGNVLFNDAVNIFYIRLYGVGHMVKNNSDCEREIGNPLPPINGLIFSISSKGCFILYTPSHR